MNEQQIAPEATVALTEEQAEKLQKLAETIRANGSVLVQTEDEAGTETPATEAAPVTVH